MPQKKTEKRGRPKAAERKQSFTASLKPSDKDKIDKKYGSLTQAVEQEIIPKLTSKTIKK